MVRPPKGAAAAERKRRRRRRRPSAATFGEVRVGGMAEASLCILLCLTAAAAAATAAENEEEAASGVGAMGPSSSSSSPFAPSSPSAFGMGKTPWGKRPVGEHDGGAFWVARGKRALGDYLSYYWGPNQNVWGERPFAGWRSEAGGARGAQRGGKEVGGRPGSLGSGWESNQSFWGKRGAGGPFWIARGKKGGGSSLPPPPEDDGPVLWIVKGRRAGEGAARGKKEDGAGGKGPFWVARGKRERGGGEEEEEEEDEEEYSPLAFWATRGKKEGEPHPFWIASGKRGAPAQRGRPWPPLGKGQDDRLLDTRDKSDLDDPFLALLP